MSDRKESPERGRDPPPEVTLYLSDAISTMKHGEVRVVIHDGCVVRIEKTEKLLCK